MFKLLALLLAQTQRLSWDSRVTSYKKQGYVVSVLNVSVSRRILERLGLVSVLKIDRLGLVSVLLLNVLWTYLTKSCDANVLH